MDNICKICNESVSERAHFWKKHRIKESNYYAQYFPRFDLLTNEPIEFKSPEQYFHTDFKDKNSLKKYLEKIDKVDGLSYLSKWMAKRQETKNLIYAPSHFELRTLCYPSIKFFHKFYGKYSYENICSLIGLNNRYNYNQELEYSDHEPEILIDTREQSVLQFRCQKEIIKLDFADYSVRGNKMFVERKSLQDFIGSLSSGFDRLCNEMQRAKDCHASIIILVESKFSNLLGFNHLGYLHTEATADYILKRARDLLLKFENVQICCVDGRIKASEFIVNLYKMKNDTKTVDFQYMVDCKMI